MDATDTRITYDLLLKLSDTASTMAWASARNKELLREAAGIVRNHEDVEKLRERIQELEEQLEDCDCDSIEEIKDERDELRIDNKDFAMEVSELKTKVVSLSKQLTAARDVEKVLGMS